MIGVFSGTFDPLHKGHEWLIEEMMAIFDKVHVVVGRNPSKERMFTQAESLAMLLECFRDCAGEIHFDVLTDRNIVDYIQRVISEEEVAVVRGIRDVVDASYELAISRAIRQQTADLHHVYLTPPEYERQIASSKIKALAQREEWNRVRRLVHPFVLNELKARVGKERVPQGHIVPWRLNTSVAGHAIKFEDGDITEGVSEFGKMPQHFQRLIDFGLMNYAPVINRAQVRNMLDPCPIDLAVSPEYHLRTIYLDSVRPTGKRFKVRSESLGPIIVDANEKLLGPDYGPAIVIEGKHRWLDATERGDKTILAWVGSKAIPFVKGPANDERGLVGDPGACGTL